MLMVLSAIGIGVAISLVYLYKNKYNIGYNTLKIYNKIDEIMENLIDTNYSSYLVDNNDYFKEIKTIDETPNTEFPIFLEKKYIKRSIYYKANFYDKFNAETDSIDLETLCDSPIIMCSLNVINPNGLPSEQYDITTLINSFVFKNCVLVLSNQDIYKKMWIMLFNTSFKSKHMYIDIGNIDDIVLKWFIILDNGDMLDGENHILKIEEGKYIK